MDFDVKYATFKDVKIDCDEDEVNIVPLKIFRTIKIDVGAFVMACKLWDGKKFMLKILLHNNTCGIKNKLDAIEVNMAKLLTKRFLLTNKTPHLVGFYFAQSCDNIKKFIEQIRPYFKESNDCRLENLIEDKSDATNIICRVLQQYDVGFTNKHFMMMGMEQCHTELYTRLSTDFVNLRKENITIDQFYKIIDRDMFQILFTLAVIKQKYPGFIHGDLFDRNVLCNIETGYSKNDYVAYHYHHKISKIFYLPANGSYVKIGDFGLSLIDNKMLPINYKESLPERKILRQPFNLESQKSDFYKFANNYNYLLTSGILSKDISKSILKIIANYYDDKYLKISIAQKMHNKITRHYYDVHGLPYEDAVLTPDQYLLSHFENYTKLPKNGIVVREYNVK